MTEPYIFLENISFELHGESDEDEVPNDLKELWISGLPESLAETGGTRFHLHKADPDGRRWESTGFVEVPPCVEELTMVVKNEGGEDTYHIQFGYAAMTVGQAEAQLEEARTLDIEVPTSLGRRIRIQMQRTFVQSDRLSYILVRLGGQAYARFDHTDDVADLQTGILLARRVLQLTPDNHPDLPLRLGNLGESLWARFEHTGDDSDLTEAISLERRALQLTPDGHPDLPLRLGNLAMSLRSHFEQAREESYLAEAISFRRRALDLTPDGHPDLPVRLSSLGELLWAWFDHTDEESYVTESISLEKRALQLTPDGHPGLPVRLGNLGWGLMSRFGRTGEDSDITEAISLGRRALQLTPDEHPEFPARLCNLGLFLSSRFDRTGQESDLAEAISAHQMVLELTPDDHPDLALRLSNLGDSIWTRFDHTGEESDINEAISLERRALQLTPDGDPELGRRASNLGWSLQSRFERTGEESDLDEAISLGWRAVQLTPDGHPGLANRLNNLGLSLLSRFYLTKGEHDLTEAISLERRALQLTPNDHPSLPLRLANLGSSLQTRFERTGEESDLVEAISLGGRALQLTPDDHPDLHLRLSNLALSLQSRFDLLGEKSDITEAILLRQRALQLTPDGHPSLCRHLLSTATLVSSQHAAGYADLKDVATAISYCKQASALAAGPLGTRLDAANEWIRLLQVHHPTSPDIIPAFDCVLSIIALGAGLAQTIDNRYSHLNSHLNDALHASATAFAFGRLDKALEWLEQGRCLVWAQLHSLRTPLDDLRVDNGTLADDIARVSKTLDMLASSRVPPRHGKTLGEKMTLEDEARVHQNLSKQWEKLIAQARLIPGFDRFLLPPLSRDLLSHLPPSGYVIVVNIHANRCDALALSSSIAGPIHIPLPTFSLEAAMSHREVLNTTLESHLLRMRQCTANDDDALVDAVARGFKQLGGRRKPAIATVLGSLWINVVKPIFDVLGLKTVHPVPGQPPPRIWWCPTGVLSFLPIHAAGLYEDGKPTVSAFDYAIPSYTPTVNSLTTRVKNNRKESKAVSGLLMTSQPSPDDRRFAHIPGTTTEVRSLELRARDSGVRALKLEGGEAPVEDFLKHMDNFSSVHLACHGSQDTTDPLSSRFIFHNGALELRQIIKENLHNADLAFLSACQTSAGEEKLANEAVHLAAGMLAAGYRRVVATMWSIGDKEAPRVAQDFYDYILERREEGDIGGFDGSLSAEALHYAIQRLRSRLDNSDRSLLAWAPYVHWGY